LGSLQRPVELFNVGFPAILRGRHGFELGKLPFQHFAFVGQCGYSGSNLGRFIAIQKFQGSQELGRSALAVGNRFPDFSRLKWGHGLLL